MQCAQLYLPYCFSCPGIAGDDALSRSLTVPCHLSLVFNWPYSWKGHLGVARNPFSEQGIPIPWVAVWISGVGWRSWMDVWPRCGPCPRVRAVARALAVCLATCFHRSGLCLCFIPGTFPTCCRAWAEEVTFSRSLGTSLSPPYAKGHKVKVRLMSNWKMAVSVDLKLQKHGLERRPRG